MVHYTGKNRIILFGIDMYTRYQKHSIGDSAAALTYYMLFAFFPFLIFLSNLLGKLDFPTLPFEQLRMIIPHDVLEIVQNYLIHVKAVSSTQLLVFGLVFSIYFPVRAMYSLMDCICRAYEVPERRGIVHRFMVVLLLAASLVFLIVASLPIMLLGKNFLYWLGGFLPLNFDVIEFWDGIRFIVMGGLLFITLTLFYVIAPSVVIHIKEALPGAMVALVGWLAFSKIFSFYVENIASYSAVYGSIGAIIVLLLWLYATSMTLIIGAEVNAFFSKKRR